MRSWLPPVCFAAAVLLAGSAPTLSRAQEGPGLGFSEPTAEGISRCLAERERGLSALARDEPIVAAGHFERAIEAFPDSFVDWYNLGCAQARQGDEEGALRSLQAASRLGDMFARLVVEDADLQSLQGLDAFNDFLRSLPARRADQEPMLATRAPVPSRELMDRLARDAEARLEELAPALGDMQRETARARIARWRAVAFDAMAERASSVAERAQLRWEALACFLHESMEPWSLHVAADVVRRAGGVGELPEERQLDAGHALAIARWALAIADSVGEQERSSADARHRSDLLELAAMSSDRPELERVLLRLAAFSVDDLPLTTGLYRRLVRVAADREAARRSMQVAAPGAVLSVEGLPSFRATLLGGEILSNSSLLGRVTVLDFWATWCRPCVADLPGLRDAWERHGEHVNLVGVAREDGATTSPAQFAAWCREHGVTWPQVFDVAPGAASLSATLGVGSVPCLLLIDADGHLVAAGAQVHSILPELERLLASRSAAPARDGEDDGRGAGRP